MRTSSLNPPLAGRQAELGELRLALGDALQGHGRLMLLSGEPGIGKTRLADELSHEAGAKGATVAWGSAWDGGGAPPYFPWTEVLRTLRPILPEPSPALARDLGPLWDAVDVPMGTALAQDASEALHFRRADALRAALALAASKQPLLIVLDDLHAADLATLRALHFIARSVRALPILLLGTQRDLDPALSGETSAQLAKIGREGSVLPLPRLDDRGLRELLMAHDPLPQKWLGQVAEASLGNPFFIHEFLRLLRTGAALDRVPDGIRLLVLERTSRLPSEARLVLDAAAVLGRDIPLGLLAEMTDLARSTLLELLASPCQAGIVQVAEAKVSFCHPLFRECLYGALLPQKRTRLHAQAARALSAEVPSSAWTEESIVRHELRALPGGAVLGEDLPGGDLLAVIERGRRAAQACRRGLAFDRAVDLLELCMSGMDECGEPCHRALRLDLDLDLAEALVFVGGGERGRALCLAVAEQARASGDVARLARAALAYGAEIRPGINDPIQVQLLEEARRVLPADQLDLSARVLARLAATRSDPEPDEPIALAHSAIQLARDTGNDDTLLQALHMGGAALVCYAGPQVRRDTARELATLATERQELVLAQRAYQRLAIDAAELLDLDELDRALASESQLGELLGHARFRWKGELLRSMRALMDGRWHDSEAAIERARSFLDELDEPAAERTWHIHRAGALMARQRGSAFDAANSVPAELAQSPGGQLMAPLVQSCLYARLDEPARALELFSRLWPLPGPILFNLSALQLALDVATRVGQKEACAVLLPKLEAAPGPANSWAAQGYFWTGLLGTTMGAAALVLGQTERAVSLLSAAASTARRLRLLPSAVEAEIFLAQARLARGEASDRARALELLQGARRSATDLGMDAAERQIDQTVARLDPPTSRSAPQTSQSPCERTEPIALSKEGEFWRLEGLGQSTMLKHSRALDILKVLLDNPHRDFHVLELGEQGTSGEAIDRGDGGEAIDGAAKRAYQERLAALCAEIDEAERWHDRGRAERLQAEHAFLAEELGRSLGAGGRLRRTQHAAERARVNVKKRLQGVIDRLSSEQSTLAAHLQSSIKTGTYVSYQPAPAGVTAS